MPSLQPLGSTVPRSGSSTGTFEPVVHISVFLRPVDLMMNYSGKTPGMTSGMSNGSSNQQVICSRVVGMLGRIVGRNGDMSRVSSNQGQISDKVGMKDRKVIIKLGRQLKTLDDEDHEVEDDPFSLPQSNPFQLSKTSSLGNHKSGVELGNGGGTSQIEMVSKLQEESSKLREQLGQALRLNEVMWNGIVQGTLKLNENE